MKILAFGDSVKLPTGYGRVSLNVLGYFALKGHEVHQIAWNHYEPPEDFLISNAGTAQTARIHLVPPFSGDPFWIDSVVQYAKLWKPDLVYNSNDFFTSEPLMNRKQDFPFFFANYGVIDGPGCAHCYRDIIKKIDVPITPSKYGYQQLKEVTSSGLYIPHGVNTSIYKPDSNKEALKATFGLQGKFVYGSANRNIWRKQYPNILLAFSHLKHNYNIKDIALFIIADPNDLQGNNLRNWSSTLDLTFSSNPSEPADVMMHPRTPSVIFPLSDMELAEAFNCWDVMVSASMSEGFGLVTIESEACGVPAIICDNSANTELVEGHGFLYPTVKSVNGSPILVPPTLKDITYWYEQPDYGAMEVSMFEAYSNKNLVKEYGKKSLAFAREYEWGKIFPQWNTLIDRAQDRANLKTK